MEKFFIMKETGKHEVEGTRMDITVNSVLCQAFITDYGSGVRSGHRCVVTELSTGYQIGFGQSKKSAKAHAESRIAIAGPERFGKMIADSIAKHGRAN